MLGWALSPWRRVCRGQSEPPASPRARWVEGCWLDVPVCTALVQPGALSLGAHLCREVRRRSGAGPERAVSQRLLLAHGAASCGLRARSCSHCSEQPNPCSRTRGAGLGPNHVRHVSAPGVCNTLPSCCGRHPPELLLHPLRQRQVLRPEGLQHHQGPLLLQQNARRGLGRPLRAVPPGRER